MEADIIRELSSLVAGKKLVSEEEIKRKAIRAALRVLGPKLADIGQQFIDQVVESVIDVPVTLNSPYYSERVEIGDAVLYHLHTHCPSKEEFEEAYTEYLESKAYLENLGKMRSITDRFFSGYSVSGQFLKCYQKDGYSYLVFYSTLKDLEEDLDQHIALSTSSNSEYVVVIPTEKDLKPFIRFFRHYSEKIRRAEIKIWVANTESLNIDPFIGYPRDFRLLSRFKNPKVAILIGSLWRVKVDRGNLD